MPDCKKCGKTLASNRFRVASAMTTGLCQDCYRHGAKHLSNGKGGPTAESRRRDSLMDAARKKMSEGEKDG